jgi:hypothetical protein
MTRYVIVRDLFLSVFSVQLLHKLSIHADDGPMKLMKVSKSDGLGWIFERF